MFDIAPTELLLCAVIALLVIGPKDLPKAMRVVGQWVGRARGVARHFRAGFDTMVREAELEEMEKKWRDENARIMSEHPPVSDPDPDPAPDLVVVPEPVTDMAQLPAPKAEPEAEAPPVQPSPVQPSPVQPSPVQSAPVQSATEIPVAEAPLPSSDAPAMLPMALPEGNPKPKRAKKA